MRVGRPALPFHKAQLLSEAWQGPEGREIQEEPRRGKQNQQAQRLSLPSAPPAAGMFPTGLQDHGGCQGSVHTLGLEFRLLI